MLDKVVNLVRTFKSLIICFGFYDTYYLYNTVVKQLLDTAELWEDHMGLR